MIPEEKKLKKIIDKAAEKVQAKRKISLHPAADFEYGDRRHGDFSIFIHSPASDKEKEESLEEIKSEVIKDKPSFIEKVEIAPQGFINFFFAAQYLQEQAGVIVKRKEKFGKASLGKGKKANVEFISANPTGPLHLGNARGGFSGDVLANVLAFAGYKVEREYYVNDLGRQIEVLKNSLEGGEPSYKNPYIDELKKEEEKDIEKAVQFIIGEIKKTTKNMGINFDSWVFESTLPIEKAYQDLKNTNMVREEKDGSAWFKAPAEEDDKDRALKKPGGLPTYFLSDLAHFRNKFQKFDRLITFLGAEHHGYVPRLKGALKALGYDEINDPDKARFIIFQLVKLFEKGREVKMSKRTGIYVTIGELIKEVGLDAARYFFLDRNYGSHLIFDLDLAKEQSQRNPVFYIQYAHARICSIMRKAANYKPKTANSKLLTHPSELNLIKDLIVFPRIVEKITGDCQVQALPRYARNFASSFHHFYESAPVISDDKDLTEARLVLVMAAQIVLKTTLELMGISAPEKM